MDEAPRNGGAEVPGTIIAVSPGSEESIMVRSPTSSSTFPYHAQQQQPDQFAAVFMVPDSAAVVVLEAPRTTPPSIPATATTSTSSIAPVGATTTITTALQQMDVLMIDGAPGQESHNIDNNNNKSSDSVTATREHSLCGLVPLGRGTSGGGGFCCSSVRRSAFDEIADSSSRIDRPHDVAVEYNRSMLLRYSIILAVLSIPLLYLTPIVGLMMCPSAALVAYWSWQRARFQHGGDMRACVNRDCSIVVGIVFICVALLIDVFNVVDLALETGINSGSGGGKKKAAGTIVSSAASLASYSRGATTMSAVPKLSGATTTTTTTTSASIRDPEDFGHTLPPEILYAHKHEEASNKPLLRKMEILAGALILLPAAATMRYLCRVRNLVINPSVEGD